MSKIYDANGNKMNVAGICAEVLQVVTDEQKDAIKGALDRYESITNSHMRLAHSILDVYRTIDSTSEQGMRLRKLLDNIMTKYQKSSNTTADDQSQYNYLIGQLLK